jgi:hypothetical protein
MRSLDSPVDPFIGRKTGSDRRFDEQGTAVGETIGCVEPSRYFGLESQYMSTNVGLAILAAGAVAAVLPNPSATTTPYAARSLGDGERLTPQQIRNYAEALLEVLQIKRALAEALKTAPSAARPLLRQQASFAVSERLRRHDIAPARFNQISERVNQDPGLRRTVRQFVMRERIGV